MCTCSCKYSFILGIFLVCFKETASLSHGNVTFKAAVYEHAVIFPKEVALKVDRSTAVFNMMKNVNEYKRQAAIAGEQNVDILVFPEDGIYGFNLTRHAIRPYLEYIPDPQKEQWNPCDNPYLYNDTEIQRELSCMAKENKMYIVANMGDFQPCNKVTDPKCPSDGHYNFNTDVAFSDKGDIIAKYHKINLYFEVMFDYPPILRGSYFDTPFGRFGLMTCFDILFEKPIKDLLENDRIVNVAFPTAWMDSLPLLAAVQYHSAFAAGANVNLLAANIKYSENRFHGSGIYTPNGYASFFYSEDNQGKLLVSEIPIIFQRKVSNVPNRDDIFKENNYTKNSQPEFQSILFHDVYNMRPLNGKTGNISICQGDFCCFLSFEKETETNEQYVFGARDGLHPRNGPYYIQVCILVKCPTTNLSSCGTFVKQAYTRFKSVKISGTFTTKYIYPEILLFGKNTLSLSSPEHWKHNEGVLQSINGFEYPLISANMFGRVYERDNETEMSSATNVGYCKGSYMYFCTFLTFIVFTVWNIS